MTYQSKSAPKKGKKSAPERLLQVTANTDQEIKAWNKGSIVQTQVSYNLQYKMVDGTAQCDLTTYKRITYFST